MTVKVKKKICNGCGSLTVIWKNHKGKRYCKYCWMRLSADSKKPTSHHKQPIPRRSRKRAAQERNYLTLRKDFLLSSQHCQAQLPGICTHIATDVHHKRGRIGSLLTDTAHWLAVCRPCHQWIETNPKEAKETGFSENRLT